MQNVARLRRRCRLLTTKLHATNKRRAVTLYQGWEDISAALDVSDTTAMEYAGRPVDPLPVWYDHASRPCIGLRALQAWVARQAHFFRTYHALKRAGKLPGQIRTEGKKQRRQIKPATRARRAA